MQLSPPRHWHSLHLFRGMKLIGIALLFTDYLVSGTIKNYIAPQMIPMVYLGALMFYGLGIVQLVRSSPRNQMKQTVCECGTNHDVQKTRFHSLILSGIFLLPIIAGVLFPAQILDSSIASKRGIQLQGYVSSNSEDLKIAQTIDKQNNIVVNDLHYSQILNSILSFPNLFKGKSIELTGFVYRDTSIKKDDIVLARYHITCCIADATVVGLLVQGVNNEKLPTNSWIHLKGTIENIQDGSSNMIPIIHLISVERIKEPKTPYVY